MRRTISVFLALAFLGYASAAAPHPPAPSPIPSPRPGEGETLEALVATALERSPALAARRAALRAAREREEPAGALPDPMVEAMLQNADFPRYTVGTVDMSMAGVEVRQGLPYPGKRHARVAAARAETELRAAELAAEEGRVTAAVRSLYARIYALDREKQARAAGRELADLLSATAAARYSAGSGEQEPILKAQLELSRLEEALEGLEGERAEAVAELGRRLGGPGAGELGEIAELPPVGDLPGDPPGDLAQVAVDASPEVLTARASLAAAEGRLAVARLDRKPDFVPSAGLATRGSLGAVLTLRFGVELPFWKKTKQEPLIRAAEAEVEMARGELADAEAMARAEAARLAARRRQAERQIVRFREAILPQSSAAFDAARASYLNGRGDFSTVVADFGLWLEARVELARREAERFVAWAEVERLTGAGALRRMP